MDCEKFDQHVIDALYEELDELTAADHKRHTESCTRCAQVLSGLRTARDAARLPLEEPSDDLEERILAAERAALRRAPWYTKVVRGAAWAGSLAMRPQLAMAALFVMVVGSSLLLLRARPGTVGAPVQVTQRGEPGPTNEPVAADQSRPESRGADLPRIAGNEARAREPEGKDAKKGDANGAAAATAAAAEAPPSEIAGAPGGGSEDAAKLLADARATKQKSGCARAIGRYDALREKFPSSPEAATAKDESAACERELNDTSAEASPRSPAHAPPPPEAFAPKMLDPQPSPASPPPPAKPSPRPASSNSAAQ